MRYRGENGVEIEKEEWLKQWDKKMLESGYYFMLNVDYIRKRLNEHELINLSPEESVSIYISFAEDDWKVDKSGG